MMKRKAISIPGFNHGQQPIPAASKVGPLVATGGVHGADLATGAIPEMVEDEVSNMFANLAGIMAAADGSLDDVARITVNIRSYDYRAALNDAWIATFPNAESRPARHTILNENLPGKMRLQCDAIAFISSSEEA